FKGCFFKPEISLVSFGNIEQFSLKREVALTFDTYLLMFSCEYTEEKSANYTQKMFKYSFY
ncbi:MAG: hypothetical protein PF437_05900, partial [Sulfurimonas sp.]|nr:hypothetical protein [Sulfurimonas sp.]